jgi:hypothetical protein
VTELGAGKPDFDFRRRQGLLLFATISRQALGHTQLLPIQWISGVNSQRRETDHSHPSNVEVKSAWSCTSSPPHVFMVWYLVKHRGNFNFLLTANKAGHFALLLESMGKVIQLLLTSFRNVILTTYEGNTEI